MATIVKRAPGIRQRFRLPYGALARARSDPLGFYSEMAQRYGDVSRWEIGPMVIHLVVSPADVKRVLQDNQKNYPRSRFYKFIKLVTGEGLVTSEGDFWRRQRRMAQPAFHHQRLAALAPGMIETIGRMLDRWQTYVENDRPFDVQTEMMRMALCIVGQALFSADISGETDEMGGAVVEAMDYLNYRINHMLAWPLMVPTPRNVRFRRAIRVTDRMVAAIIDQRRRSAGGQHDLLALMMAARDEETGGQMSDRQLRDEVVTFIGAGHETTAVALAWTWYLLANHSHCEQRLRTEVNEVLAGRPPTVEDLPRLSYTRMVFEEALRLYPPVWAMSRDVVEDDQLGGYHIPRGSLVLVSPFITHRHPAYWTDPETFDPQRFLPERAKDRPRCAYFPFAAGPHQCIGAELATMEAQFAIAMIVQRFRVRLDRPVPIEPDPIFTLRPKGGVHVRLESVLSAVPTPSA